MTSEIVTRDDVLLTLALAVAGILDSKRRELHSPGDKNEQKHVIKSSSPRPKNIPASPQATKQSKQPVKPYPIRPKKPGSAYVYWRISLRARGVTPKKNTTSRSPAPFPDRRSSGQKNLRRDPEFAEMWENLSKAEKEPFERKHAEAMKIYRKRVAEYCQAIGFKDPNTDLIDCKDEADAEEAIQKVKDETMEINGMEYNIDNNAIVPNITVAVVQEREASACVAPLASASLIEDLVKEKLYDTAEIGKEWEQNLRSDTRVSLDNAVWMSNGTKHIDQMLEKNQIKEFVREKDMEAVGCVCGCIQDDGKTMIQCEQCYIWQHTSCFGLPETPPSNFLFLCNQCLIPQINSANVAYPWNQAKPLNTSTLTPSFYPHDPNPISVGSTFMNLLKYAQPNDFRVFEIEKPQETAQSDFKNNDSGNPFQVPQELHQDNSTLSRPGDTEALFSSVFEGPGFADWIANQPPPGAFETQARAMGEAFDMREMLFLDSREQVVGDIFEIDDYSCEYAEGFVDYDACSQ